MENKHSRLLPQKYKMPPWYWEFSSTTSLIKLNVEIYIKSLNLTDISSFEDVQNNIYIVLFNLDNSGKLIFYSENKTFIYIKKDASRSEIKNFPAWCKTISFNYLKKLRRERNKLENFIDIDIDDCYVRNKVCTEVLTDYLDSEEIREKVNLLKKLDRRIIELCFFEEYKFEEISNKLEGEGLGIFTTVALRQRKLRALEKLRKHFLPKFN